MKQQSQEPLTSPELVDWIDPQEQQFWFDRYASGNHHERDDGVGQPAGLRFQQFQEFLSSSLYSYYEKFPPGEHQQEAKSDDLTGAMAKVGLNDASTVGLTKQQEMHLFKRFDVDNDHLIDRDEFALLCQKWLHRVFNPRCALVVVDVQNDFIDGSLALINGPAGQDGAEVVPVVNDLVDACQLHKATIVYTQDWHPQDHLSFHDNLYMRKHKLKDEHVQETTTTTTTTTTKNGSKLDASEDKTNGSNSKVVELDEEKQFTYKKFDLKAKLFDTVLFDDGRVEQKLWPRHCVSNSWGAQMHPKLKIAPDSVKIQKGTLSHVDAYSAFWDNMRSNETGLRQELLAKGVTDVFFCGLALDYCVAASALDAAKAGFITFVVEDACRGIDLKEIEKRKQELIDAGAILVKSDIVDTYLSRDHHSAGKKTSFQSSLDRCLIKSITYRKAFT